MLGEERNNGGSEVNTQIEGVGAKACWFVGATFGGTDDQTSRFLREGIWENGYQDRYLDLVKSIQPGDLIAIKSTYTRKNNLPFDNRGFSVSVLVIKSIGTVIENCGDGRNLRVDWNSFDPVREWYFYTNRNTVWRVLPGNWYSDGLIGFTFEGKSQDLDRFRNEPYWRDRFGDRDDRSSPFKWSGFYEEVANKLLTFQSRRNELFAGILDIASKVNGFSIVNDQFADGSIGPIKDICPFTVFGIFNRGITETNRKVIANELARLLGVSVPVPDSFDGIPILNNQKSWFYGYEKDRRQDDIGNLWEVFARAIDFADSPNEESQSNFAFAYDKATHISNTGWNLTMGLYWIRPWNFPTLDGQSRLYIEKKLNIHIDLNGPKRRCNATDFLKVLETLEVRFKEDTYPVHSFPDLSFAAWLYGDSKASDTTNVSEADAPGDEANAASEEEFIAAPLVPYSIDNIVADGCFIGRDKLQQILDRFSSKKNLILQGPPGTGKTWLAKRLAFALIRQRDDNKVRAVQFHPNLSYEDFIRGWRPMGDGKLSLVDGPFMEMIEIAINDPGSNYVVVIEEVNRGNPAQIFGEMLTLLEADKRTPNEALELSYRQFDGERVYIPANLYVIGTMNIADRSLALVDLALRRRFAFIDLEPKLGKPWREWVQTRYGFDSQTLDRIESNITVLNEMISADSGLGPQYRVGHSYVTPTGDNVISDGGKWFRQVVETEIGPLLDEYWFDSPATSKKAKERLLEGF